MECARVMKFTRIAKLLLELCRTLYIAKNRALDTTRSLARSQLWLCRCDSVLPEGRGGGCEDN